MWNVARSLRQHDKTRAVRWIVATTALGALFLAIQGSEWARRIRFGLTMTSSVYGGMLYLIVGAHALHLAVAVAVLSFVAAWVWGRAIRIGLPRRCRVFGVLVIRSNSVASNLCAGLLRLNSPPSRFRRLASLTEGAETPFQRLKVKATTVE